MEYTLIDGTRVSRIGLGTWAIGGDEWGAVDERESILHRQTAFGGDVKILAAAMLKINIFRWDYRGVFE